MKNKQKHGRIHKEAPEAFCSRTLPITAYVSPWVV